MVFRSKGLLVVCSLSLLAFTGCTKKPKEAPAETQAKQAKQAEQADHAGHGGHAGHAAADKALKPSKIDPNAKVFFKNLKPGQKVEGALKDGKVLVDVQMGASGVEIVPAGKQVDFSGHHHIVIDGEPVPFGKAVPADDNHIHFGKGQVETQVPLSPGKHSLTLQLADGFHLSYGPKQSAKVEIEVVAR